MAVLTAVTGVLLLHIAMNTLTVLLLGLGREEMVFLASNNAVRLHYSAMHTWTVSSFLSTG